MTKKKSTNKELLEAGTKFTIEGFAGYVFSVKVDKDKTAFLKKYHTGTTDLIVDTAIVRRLGENNLDYRAFDILGKRTRGRIQYAAITFKVEAPKPKDDKKAKAKADKFAKAKAKQDAKELVSSLTDKKEEPKKVYGPIEKLGKVRTS